MQRSIVGSNPASPQPWFAGTEKLSRQWVGQEEREVALSLVTFGKFHLTQAPARGPLLRAVETVEPWFTEQEMSMRTLDVH